MKPVLTSLPDPMRPLHSLPLSLPAEKGTTPGIKSNATETFIIENRSSTMVDDPSGWDESWFANYE